MRAIIFANGDLNYFEDAPEINASDLVIAADGGARHAARMGIVPAFVVGDMDSLDPAEVAALEKKGTALVLHPARKALTDLELAINLAVEKGASDIIILGGFGGRWDMTVSNLLLTASENYGDVSIRFVDGSQEAGLVRAGQPMSFHGKLGDTFSLVPIGGDAEGVFLSGLEYGLDNETLPLGESRGISNVFSAETATVSLKRGLLLYFIIRQNN